MKIVKQSELKECLYYDPETGVFTWLVSNNNFIKIGDIAGALNKDGYFQIKINRVIYRSHRIAFLYMMGKFPLEQVDHIKNIRSDNRWLNLRAATGAENTRNRGVRSDSLSGFKGVTLNKNTGNYQARCKVNGKKVSLGTYATATEASSAYIRFAKINHGEFFHAIPESVNKLMEKLR